MKSSIVIMLVIAGILVVGVIGYAVYSQNAYGVTSGNNLPGGGVVMPAGNSIIINNFVFSPSTLTIKVGDTVTWTNSDSAAHTVISDSGSELASGTLANGQGYSHTFTTKETYNYHCSIHPMMKGIVVVN